MPPQQKEQLKAMGEEEMSLVSNIGTSPLTIMMTTMMMMYRYGSRYDAHKHEYDERQPDNDGYCTEADGKHESRGNARAVTFGAGKNVIHVKR